MNSHLRVLPAPRERTTSNDKPNVLLDFVRRCGRVGLKLTPGILWSLRVNHGITLKNLNRVLAMLVRNRTVTVSNEGGFRRVRIAGVET